MPQKKIQMTFRKTHDDCSLPRVIAFFALVAGFGLGLVGRDLTMAQEAASPTQTPSQPSPSQRLLDSMMDPEDHTVLIAAHRGGYTNDVADDAPENSVANVAVAVSKGYEVFETDIQRTADGVFVMAHDPTIERETNGTGTVESKTLQELQQLRKRFRDGTLSNHKVATLGKFLDAGNGQILFKPDLKPGMIDHFDQLARQIAKHPAAKQVFLRTAMSDADAIAKYFANGTPKVEVMFKVKESKQVQKIHKLFSPVTIQIDIREGEPISESRLEAIRTARELGILVETHAYDSPDQTAILLDAGVRMLHTKKPDTIRKLLNSRSLKSKSAAPGVTKTPMKKPIDKAWQAIDLRRDEIVVTGVPTQQRTQDEIRFNRFSEDLLSMKKKVLSFNPGKARSTTGVVLHFMTESPEIQLQFELQEGGGRGPEFSVFQNGQLRQEESYQKKEKNISLSIRSETPGKPTHFSVAMPSWANPKLTGFQIRPECKMQTPKVPERVYVALGDSISHGTGQGSATHKTWPFLLSRKLNVSLCNLAVGGGKISLPAAQSLSQFERVDLVTILVGYNDWNSGISPEDFGKKYSQSLAAIRKSHPAAKIVCVTATYTKSTTSKRSSHTLDEFRQAIRDAAKENSDDKHPIVIIEGEELTSEANLRSDRDDPVHFSEDGAQLFAEELAVRLTEHPKSALSP